MRTFSLEDIHAARKRRDSWWTVFVVDPPACRLALGVANRTQITPNALTVFALVLGMASAALLAANQLWAGALLFYLSFMIDCIDGKIARLKGTGTPFGLWLDYVGDRIRVVFCAAGLAYGQYAATGDILFVLVGAGIAVLDLFRYVNAPQMKRVRDTVKRHRRALYAPRPREEASMTGAETLGEAGAPAGAQAGTAVPAMRFAAAGEGLAGHAHDRVHLSLMDTVQMEAVRVDTPHPGSAATRQTAHAQAVHPQTMHPRAVHEAETGHGVATGHPQGSAGQGGGPFAPHAHAVHGAETGRDAGQAGGPFVAHSHVLHEAETGRDVATEHAQDPAEQGGGPFRRFDRFLARHRVRSHLISGIEFHAAVFVVAPLIGAHALVPVSVGAGALLLANEIFLVYRMWLYTRGAGVPAEKSHEHALA
ncbi:CDP-alcohol phosphatidyltransferase family protein [Sinosporangium siamense]|nr:CDP-alcohol phosphatidyltransferase family protein [Sinosporangium siamense]